jgi:hypothetical protein
VNDRHGQRPQPDEEAMRALMTAIIFFGSFLLLGWAIRFWLQRRASHLLDDQKEDAGGRKGRRFLLGAWYRDE